MIYVRGMDLKRHMLRQSGAGVKYSAAYSTGRERMLEPRNGCARAKGVGLPERSEPEGPQGAARERIAI